MTGVVGACVGDEVGAVRTAWAGVRRLLVITVLLAVWATLPSSAATPRDGDLVARIPLGPAGYQTILPEFMLSGSSMLTVHFVDSNHLLVTFGARRLMKREPDDPPEDQDRMVGAALMELPSGKVLAQTEWRMHDRAQYLWSLGHGRFLLRVRDRLTVIAPMSSSDPFRGVPLVRLDRHIVVVLLSAENDLLTLETVKRASGPSGVASGVVLVDPELREGSAQVDSAPVQINFFRLKSTGSSAEGVHAIPAGVIRSPAAVALPLTAAGFLDTQDSEHDRWAFNFEAHSGAESELAVFNSSCFPRSNFVDHGEFVSFGCRGSAEKQVLAGFNLKGDEMWQQNFYDLFLTPTFAYAPAAGRFALGRTIVKNTVDPEMALWDNVVSAQEIRVIQSYSGKLLFRTSCTPAERSGENFALSPDGMKLAVVHETTVHHAVTKDYDEYTENEAAIEVYALPPLSAADQTAVKAAEAMAPQDSGARIDQSLARVSSLTKNERRDPETAAAEPIGTESAAAAEAAMDAQEAPSATKVEGDPVPEAPRKRPTLYGSDEPPKPSK